LADRKYFKKSLSIFLLIMIIMGFLRTFPVYATASTPFYIGNALHFAKSDDSASIDWPLTTQVDNITMETWVKADTISSDATFIRIMYNGNSANSGYGIYLAGADKAVSI